MRPSPLCCAVLSCRPRYEWARRVARHQPRHQAPALPSVRAPAEHRVGQPARHGCVLQLGLPTRQALPGVELSLGVERAVAAEILLLCGWGWAGVVVDRPSDALPHSNPSDHYWLEGTPGALEIHKPSQSVAERRRASPSPSTPRLGLLAARLGRSRPQPAKCRGPCGRCLGRGPWGSHAAL